MRFEFGGKVYVIDFERKYRQFQKHDYVSGLDSFVKSKFPYTTATIYETDPTHPLDKKVFRTATAGCFHRDNFSLEKGRCRALRLVTMALPKEMKPVLWKAYHERPRPKSEPKDPVASTVGEGDGDPSAQVVDPIEA